jgi:very-short-patch-repair endonuclease
MHARARQPVEKSEKENLTTTDVAVLLYRQISEAKLPGQFYGNHPISETRKWTIDIALLSRYPPLAIEVEGWGHRTRKRFLSDIEKYNFLTFSGWSLLRVTPQMVKSGAALTLLRAYLGKEKAR